jgi:hypothetical protein
MAKKAQTSKKPPKRLEPDDRQIHSQEELFLTLSAALTGFDRAELQGTGMVDTYFGTVPSIVGEEAFAELLTAWHEVLDGRGSQERGIEKKILADPFVGPVAISLTYLWYTGSWQQLPWAWRNEYGANVLDTSRVVSGEAYVEGLVWKAMQTHPQGAKQPGFGSWAIKPKGA